MKIRTPSSILFLLPALSTALGTLPAASRATGYVQSGSFALDARYTDSGSLIDNVAKGSLDVPVDGKDGRPHAGPWVETSAERDRKSTKGNEDADPVSTKYDAKIPSSEHISTGEGKMIPHSNGGVMDDPQRAGPKEGTRGTEGGVSEKGKQNYNMEKVPGAPKEAPPLPHSDTTDRPLSNTQTGSSDGSGTLGMLEVSSSLRLAWGLSYNADRI